MSKAKYVKNSEGFEIMKAEKIVDRGIVGVAAHFEWANSNVCKHRELNTSLLGLGSSKSFNTAT